jgi:hypothetical protein
VLSDKQIMVASVIALVVAVALLAWSLGGKRRLSPGAERPHVHTALGGGRLPRDACVPRGHEMSERLRVEPPGPDSMAAPAAGRGLRGD